MSSNILSYITKFNAFIIFVIVSCFLTSCMTSSQQQILQDSINKVQNQVNAIKTQLASKDLQINNTTQTAIASQNESQNVKDQLLLTQGAVDELKNTVKKLQENAGSQSTQGQKNLATESPALIQKQIARLQLLAGNQLSENRVGKLPSKLSKLDNLNSALKLNLDKENFKKVFEIASTVLNAKSASESMLATALEYRGEAKFQMQNFKGAALDLSLLLEIFPNTPRKSRALLLAGDSFVYLKNKEVAQLYYQDCVNSYATEAEGKAAATRLTTLKAQISASSTH